MRQLGHQKFERVTLAVLGVELKTEVSIDSQGLRVELEVSIDSQGLRVELEVSIGSQGLRVAPMAQVRFVLRQSLMFELRNCCAAVGRNSEHFC